MLQNLIGNSIRYSERPPHIQISTHLNEGRVHFTLTDNGIGMEASKKLNTLNDSKKDSFSTNTIKEKLFILKDLYNTDIVFEYKNVEIGTKIVLKIPFNKEI